MLTALHSQGYISQLRFCRHHYLSVFSPASFCLVSLRSISLVWFHCVNFHVVQFCRVQLLLVHIHFALFNISLSVSIIMVQSHNVQVSLASYLLLTLKM